MASLLDLRGLLRRHRPSWPVSRDALAVLLLVAAAVGLELYARAADSILEELLAAGGVTVLGTQVWRRYGARLRGAPLAVRLRAWIAARRVRIGVDLRDEPSLPTYGPGLQALCCLALGSALWGLAHSVALWPTSVLELLRGWSGLLASGLSVVLWGALLVGTFGALLMPSMLLDGSLRERRVAARHREVVMLYACGAQAVVVLLAAFALPGWMALAFAATGVLSGAWLYVPGRPPLRFAWKRGIDAAPASMPAWLWLSSTRLFHYGVFVLLSMLAAGSSLFDVEGTREGITSFLGLCFAWCTAGASTVLAFREVRHGWTARLSNPARPAPPIVRVRGAADEAARDLVRRRLEPHGFALRFGDETTALERWCRRLCGARRGARLAERLRLPAPEAELLLGEAEGDGWPRPVRPGGLGDPRLHDALLRRVQLQSRRRLRRGLKVLFALAKRRRTPASDGIGHWVAPHLWYVLHMGRDGQDEVETIGPAYHRLFDRATRHHVHTVLGALDVDLIFVEDSVTFPRFQRVLSLVFEFYDMFGERALEERHFQGLNGIRVLIEELRLEEPLTTTDYPEPDYEQLARARILLVFRDRGGELERDRLIPDFDSLPLTGSFV